MVADTNKIRGQVNELWKQAVDQLEDVKEMLTRSRSRIEGDLVWLRKERDRLLKVLGEQTYKLANQGKLPMPQVVKDTVERLNKVIDRLVAQAGRSKKKAAKKAPRKKAAKKAPAA